MGGPETRGEEVVFTWCVGRRILRDLGLGADDPQGLGGALSGGTRRPSRWCIRGARDMASGTPDACHAGHSTPGRLIQPRNTDNGDADNYSSPYPSTPPGESNANGFEQQVQ